MKSEASLWPEFSSYIGHCISVGLALRAVHKKRIAHRDVKPGQFQFGDTQLIYSVGFLRHRFSWFLRFYPAHATGNVLLFRVVGQDLEEAGSGGKRLDDVAAELRGVISEELVAKLADFGFACEARTRSQSTMHTVVGTPGYEAKVCTEAPAGSCAFDDLISTCVIPLAYLWLAGDPGRHRLYYCCRCRFVCYGCA